MEPETSLWPLERFSAEYSACDQGYRYARIGALLTLVLGLQEIVTAKRWDGSLVSAKMAVIIADDDPLVRTTYKFCFERAGFESFTADDGRQALHLLDRHNNCILLLDVFMPGMDGIETLLEVRRLHPRVPVIVFSGGTIGQYDFLGAAQKLGASAVVRKPASPQQLVAIIERVGQSSSP